MAKDAGYTFAIATRNPNQTFVLCKWFTDVKLAIEYAQGEIRDRSQYDVEFILIREGTTNKDDPIIWDSRKHLVINPMRAMIEDLYKQNNYDNDTYEKLLSALGDK